MGKTSCREGKICGYFEDNPVYHGEELIITLPETEPRPAMAFYSFEFTGIWAYPTISVRYHDFDYGPYAENCHSVALYRVVIERDPSFKNFEKLFV